MTPNQAIYSLICVNHDVKISRMFYEPTTKVVEEKYKNQNNF